jgi:hypothetical protein
MLAQIASATRLTAIIKLRYSTNVIRSLVIAASPPKLNIQLPEYRTHEAAAKNTRMFTPSETARPPGPALSKCGDATRTRPPAEKNWTFAIPQLSDLQVACPLLG